MSTETRDVIDLLAGIEPGSSLDGIRARRLQARDNAQRSYLVLFEPVDFADVAALERYAVAAFVAGVHGEPAAAGFYLSKLAKTADRAELVEALQAEIERAKTQGPYGAFPAGPLSVEDQAGLIYRVAPDRRRVLGERLAAALEHAHLLVFRPRDATPAAMQALLAAGWSSTAIVTLSQLVAFLSFQVRTVAGLRTLGATLGRDAAVKAAQGASGS
jgi:CMD domain protein